MAEAKTFSKDSVKMGSKFESVVKGAYGISRKDEVRKVMGARWPFTSGLRDKINEAHGARDMDGAFSYGLALAMARTSDDDMAQDAMLKAWAFREQYDASEGASFATWLETKMHDVRADRYRKAKCGYCGHQREKHDNNTYDEPCNAKGCGCVGFAAVQFKYPGETFDGQECEVGAERVWGPDHYITDPDYKIAPSLDPNADLCALNGSSKNGTAIFYPSKRARLAFNWKAEGYSNDEIARAFEMAVGVLEVYFARWRKKTKVTPARNNDRPKTAHERKIAAQQSKIRGLKRRNLKNRVKEVSDRLPAMSATIKRFSAITPEHRAKVIAEMLKLKPTVFEDLARDLQKVLADQKKSLDEAA